MYLSDAWIEPRIRRALGACLFMMIVTAVVALVWWPQYDELREAKSQLSEIRIAARVQSRLKALETSYRKQSSQLEALSRRLSFRGGQAALVKIIGDLAERDGVTVAQLYEPRNSAGGYNRLGLQLAVNGSYSSTRNFIRDLAEIPLWISADQFELARADDRNQSVRMTLLATVYISGADGK